MIFEVTYKSVAWQPATARIEGKAVVVFRDIKVTMDAENIQAESVVMMLKELFTSIVAYNLIAQFRRQAAKLAGVAPRRLSFTRGWTSFRDRLLLKEPRA